MSGAVRGPERVGDWVGRPAAVGTPTIRLITGADGNTIVVAKYLVNAAAVAHCRKLIDAHQYVVSSDWGTRSPLLSSRTTTFS